LEGWPAIRTIEDIGLVDFHHRQPAPLGVDAVVVFGQLFLTLEQRFARREPCLTRDDRRMRHLVVGHVNAKEYTESRSRFTFVARAVRSGRSPLPDANPCVIY